MIKLLLDPAPPTEEASGGAPAGSAGAAALAPSPEPAAPASPGEPTKPGAPVTPATPASIQVTPEALAQAMRAAGVGAQPAAPVAPAVQPTQADFDAAFKVVRPNKEQLAKILAGGDEALLTFTELLHAASRQAVVMSAYQLQEMKADWDSRLTPLQQAHSKQVEEQLRTEFWKENPDLKQMEPVMEEIIKGYRAENRQFKSKAECFATVKADTMALVKKLIPDWKPGEAAPAVAAVVPTPSLTKMPTLARGGGAGAAAGGKLPADATKSPGRAVFM